MLFRYIRFAPHLKSFRPVAIHVNYHSDKGHKMARSLLLARFTPPWLPADARGCPLISCALTRRCGGLLARAQVLIAQHYLENVTGALDQCAGDGCAGGG